MSGGLYHFRVIVAVAKGITVFQRRLIVLYSLFKASRLIVPFYQNLKLSIVDGYIIEYITETIQFL